MYVALATAESRPDTLPPLEVVVTIVGLLDVIFGKFGLSINAKDKGIKKIKDIKIIFRNFIN
jgi:hypothetical protein